MIAAWTLLGAIIPGSAAFGFDPGHHRQFTRTAFILYRERCQPSFTETLDESHRENLARGAADEDEIDSVSRATNWHFYNRYRAVPNRWWARTTLDSIFEVRIEELRAALADRPRDSARVYYLAGRVLHYIQDMSVPAHVAPIYHFKLRLLFVEIGESDPFDGYEPPEGALDSAVDGLNCDELAKTVPTELPGLRQMLDATAAATLLAIGQGPGRGDEPEAGTGMWKHYWGDPAEKHERDPETPGFARYGGCRFVRWGNPPGCGETGTLDLFFGKRYRRVIEDTIRVLIFVDRILAAW
jgi:hypothetical protein